jgi:hypothetical protein
MFFFFFYDKRTGERMREKTRVVVFFRVVGTTKNEVPLSAFFAKRNRPKQ